MSTRRVLRPSAVLVILLLLGVFAAGGAGAQEARATEFYIGTGIIGGDCTGITIATHRNALSDRRLTAIVMQNGVIVQDFAGSHGPSNGTSSFGIFYQNSRDLAPVNLFPLDPNKPIDIFFGLWTNEWEPIYEWRARVKSCANLVAGLKKVEHGPAHVLTFNAGFEGIGFDSLGATDATAAAFWKGKNAVNDLRTCDTTSNYVGTCGLKLTADPGLKSKFVNKYNGQIGQAGDNVLLNFFANAFPGYSGGGKVIGKLTLANGQTLKLSVDISPAASWGASTPVFVWANLPAPIIAAKTMIKQGFGTGSVAVDAVTLSVFTSAGDVLRTLPVPAFAGAASFDLSADN